jgi:hypothetical protein
MLISNANAVGTELVNQLGGTGYKPSEWADAINLLGISDDDKASALAGITSGTYTGTERGAIKYSNCNAVGSMLNKKFSTDRGFKPVEWESAISKLTPLAEGTVSGSICNIVNGADDVPVSSWQVTLPASLDGYTEVNGVRTGKNLFDGYTKGYGVNSSTGAIFTNNNGAISGYIPIKPNTAFYVSGLTDTIHSFIAYYKADKTYISRTNGSNRTYVSATTPNECYFVIVYQYANNDVGTIDDVDNLQTQLEVGSTATTYEPYTAPTTATASLGRTVYGGTADVVNGTGVDNCERIQIKNRTWEAVTVGSFQVFSTNKITNKATNFNFQVEGYENAETYRNYLADKQCGTYNTTNAMDRIVIRDDSYSTVEDFLEAKGDNYIVYEKTSSTDFTFTPITPTPETPLGVSNWWADNGDSTITYRKDPDIPDPPVQLLNMNNNNEDNNEGV